MSAELQSPVRFIKKIPPSGGAPSYKLTLNHSVVQQHLSHCVDVSFELASSATTTQTWQGCIAPRRNKQRNEYVLQGWKLFAEAHKIQAGDQVSFEMTAPWRLVVKCIQPATAGSSALSLAAEDFDARAESPAQSPSKSLRINERSSPSRRSAWSTLEETTRDQLHTLLRNVPGRMSFSDALAEAMSPPSPSPRMAHRVQSWMSLSSTPPTPMLHMPEGRSEPSPVRRRSLTRDSWDQAIQKEQTEPVTQDLPPAHDLAVQDRLLPVPPLDALPGIFDDIDADIEDMVPDLPLEQALSMDETRMGSLSSVLQSQKHRPLKAGQMFSVPKEPFVEMDEIEQTVSIGLRDRLHQSTRSALHATMRIENTVVNLPGNGEPIDAKEVQANMFRELSALKESLWQVLVVSNDLQTS